MPIQGPGNPGVKPPSWTPPGGGELPIEQKLELLDEVLKENGLGGINPPPPPPQVPTFPPQVPPTSGPPQMPPGFPTAPPQTPVAGPPKPPTTPQPQPPITPTPPTIHVLDPPRQNDPRSFIPKPILWLFGY